MGTWSEWKLLTKAMYQPNEMCVQTQKQILTAYPPVPQPESVIVRWLGAAEDEIKLNRANFMAAAAKKEAQSRAAIEDSDTLAKVRFSHD